MLIDRPTNVMAGFDTPNVIGIKWDRDEYSRPGFCNHRLEALGRQVTTLIDDWHWLAIQLAMDHAQATDLTGRVIGGANQPIRLHPLEADLLSMLAPFRELFPRVIAIHGHVLLARLQVLADREDTHAPAALVAHHGL